MNYDLFIQTGYSFNGSIIDIDTLVKIAKTKGFETLGIADHNHLYGFVKFYRACKEAGIRPVLGMHVNIRDAANRDIPMLLFVKSEIGYRNLIEISSYLGTEAEFLPGTFLAENHQDLICIALTNTGDIHHAILNGDIDLAKKIIADLSLTLPDFYLGLDLNDFVSETKIAPELARLSKTVITNRVMYYEKDDQYASSVLCSILNEASQVNEGMFEAGQTVYDLKSPEVLADLYRDYSAFAHTTESILSEIHFDFQFDRYHLPKFPVPDQHDAFQYLVALAKKGLEKRLRNKLHPGKSIDEYNNRLEHELSIIHNMGYEDYFLIVWDFVLYAKKNQILVGPGRGSAAGSLVAYVLGIVDVDPLDFDLYFERFLNPERITMPDIDMDFPDDKRDQVIQYVCNKYGKMHVTSIVTFGTFQGKSALRDVARILQVKDIIVDEVTKYVGETENSISEFIKHHPDKYRHLMEMPEVEELFSVAAKLVDLPRHISTHAAGIIITDQEITEYVPIQNGLMEMYQTQYEATDLEQLGLLKIDFLGIRNLTMIARVAKLIKEKENQDIDIYKLPLDDQKTFQLLREVRTLGIFQLESRGMMSLMRQMQIRNFEDISTCIALFRPGPMDNIPAFLRRRNHQEKVTYLHPDLEPILRSTEGIIVYQEQIMKIANDFAGYTLGEADVLRRAVSKKKESALLEERERFVQKSLQLHRSEHISNQIYDYIVKFANYGFNKSHSVAYSMVAYWMAYLKANYPDYFMTVLMDSAIGSQSATKEYIRECRNLGIQILPPSINLSEKTYKSENGNLRFPYLGIRNIGAVVAERIEAIKGGQPFTSFVDFITRARDLNTRVIESMIMAGMFDEFSQTKQTMVENLRQISLSLSLGQNLDAIGFVFVEYPEYDNQYLIEQERELIGFNLSYHPISRWKEEFEKRHISLLSDVIKEEDCEVGFAGLLTKIKIIQTKKGEEMAFLEFEDTLGSLEAVLFPKGFEENKNQIEVGTVWIVHGTIETRNQRKQVLVGRMEKLGGTK